MGQDILRAPVTGRSLWAPEDFQGDSWIWRISCVLSSVTRLPVWSG